ncbi:MAG: undecaprenyl-diphosphate phosphatase, partial [Kiritimatiellae bacterium]|nr:undecaprenyl-diphosphate phosphatase [Kiritimatiellia bacterium]
MHELINVFVLAVLQGLTEFLPVSSSGHLVIAQELLDIQSSGIRLEVMLHLGTMLSIIIYYRVTLFDLVCGFFKGDRASMLKIGYVSLSAIPAVFFYVIFHDRIDAFYEDPRAVGGFMIFTGVV